MKRSTIGMREVHVTNLHIGRCVPKTKHKHFGQFWFILAAALMLLVGGIAIASLLGSLLGY